jgi:type IV pilus assembly protein PilC
MAKVADRPSAPKKITYRYEALADGRRKVKGTIKVSSEVAGQNLLVEKGYSAITMMPMPSTFSLEGALPSFFSVKPAQVVAFSKQLATLLESGVSLLPALQLLAQQGSNPAPLRRILTSITSDLSTGSSLSVALGKHDQVFNEIYRRTIEVGERTGNLQIVLRDLAEHMEKQAVFGKKLSGALTYPAIIFVVGIVVSIILLTVVLPPLADLFSTFDAELPLPTKILLGASNLFGVFKLYIFAAMPVIAVGLVMFLRTPRGQASKDWLGFHIPLLGAAALMGELARLGRTMSLMLTAGLSLQDTMELMPETTTNSLFKTSLAQVRSRLFLGQGLAYPMAADPLFPPLMLQMVRVGEDSNTLDVTMKVVADFYEAAAEQRTQAIVTLITPLSTIILASLVGFVALSVIMPMYNLTSAF